MKQNVSPAVAAVAILLTLGVSGLLLWYFNRERPRPTHYGLPPGLQQMEDARASSFMPKPGQQAKPGNKMHSKPTGNAGNKTGTASDAKGDQGKHGNE